MSKLLNEDIPVFYKASNIIISINGSDMTLSSYVDLLDKKINKLQSLIENGYSDLSGIGNDIINLNESKTNLESILHDLQNRIAELSTEYSLLLKDRKGLDINILGISEEIKCLNKDISLMEDEKASMISNLRDEEDKLAKNHEELNKLYSLYDKGSEKYRILSDRVNDLHTKVLTLKEKNEDKMQRIVLIKKKISENKLDVDNLTTQNKLFEAFLTDEISKSKELSAELYTQKNLAYNLKGRQTFGNDFISKKMKVVDKKGVSNYENFTVQENSFFANSKDAANQMAIESIYSQVEDINNIIKNK